jgi:thiamine-monophosphate kinase
VRSPDRISLSVTALGSVPAGKAVLRSGARPGDLVCVTGVLGESGAGLTLLERGGRPRPAYRPLLEWHRRPRPPVRAGAALAAAGLATAMMDLSDGLASDLRHLARRSGAGAEIQSDRLPISDAARRAAAELGVDPVHWALHGGEDYQLLFTVAPDRFTEVPPVLGPFGVTATVIGRIRAGRAVTVRNRDGAAAALLPAGFQHFA